MSIDLRRGELVPGAQGASYDLANFENAFGMSQWADVRGDGGDNLLGALACRGGATGYGGDDEIVVFKPNGAFSRKCGKLDLEAFGSANIDVCVAERERACER